MKISDIYQKYKIMPQLQLHMLRVSAVAEMICGNFKKQIDRESVISASLLHDMGNIVKFDMNLNIFPGSWYLPKGKEYWKKIKKDFTNKYGDEDHIASYRIAEEVTSSNKVLSLIKAVGFKEAKKNYKDVSFEKKVCNYSDMRVMPYKIDSLKNRLSEVKKRYAKKAKEKGWTDFDDVASLYYIIENQIFTNSLIKPSDITEEKARPIIKRLKDFEIKTS